MRAWVHLPYVISPSPPKCRCGSRSREAYGRFRFTDRRINATGETIIEPEVCLEELVCPDCYKAELEGR